MQRVLLLLILCLAIPAQAGLLEDDEARQQIKALEARVQKLEDAVKQQTKSMLDLQSLIDALNTEIRNLRGQNEEAAHGLQDAEKRQKDFYVDLDTRMRHFESAELAAKAAPKPPAAPVTEPSGPLLEGRAFETAYGLLRAGNITASANSFQDFLKKFPDSIHVPNAEYFLGSAQFALEDYLGALATYQGLLKDFPDTPKTADVMFEIAGCQQKLKRSVSARKTLKQLVAKYPASEAAAKAKKLLAAAK
jgi:tol-pal system protein YbgF